MFRLNLFRSAPHNNALQESLRQAASRQRQGYLLELLHTHGAREYAYALNDLSGRTIENALSTLPTIERSQVLKHLSRRAKARLNDAEGFRSQPTHAVLTLPSFMM
ncbi:hypothetical protein GCM10010096_21080 [Alcaligenes pakistanensis]|uniref:Uncharacterized protein n=1 Tax=Alcaligenes pakistanensis TaxID=1482717 RepID=A0A8H9IHY7_9BURK|nr:hypothetical protein [Alcaligenes pakistanensis]MBP6622091.1 hypothetical protein [Alcaligenes sp.]GHC49168.1 hypothetical protein GCM10010096_21080 [Alcaligenes pakistanensis]HCA17693.1 hypothetical protein [Alcaligenes faecalis]